MSKQELVQALAVTAEVTGSALTEGAIRVMLADLASYPVDAVLSALARCRREVRGRLSLADIIQRIDSGHPGPEEAWSLVAHALGDERETLVLTTPMRVAYWRAEALFLDPIAARMAFIETYRREVATAGPPDWHVLPGWDGARRDVALRQAVEQGKLTAAYADKLLAHVDAQMPEQVKGLLDGPGAV